MIVSPFICPPLVGAILEGRLFVGVIAILPSPLLIAQRRWTKCLSPLAAGVAVLVVRNSCVAVRRYRMPVLGSIVGVARIPTSGQTPLGLTRGLFPETAGMVVTPVVGFAEPFTRGSSICKKLSCHK